MHTVFYLDFFMLHFADHTRKMGLSKGSLERLNKIINVAKTVVHVGFVPTILYLGFQKGADPGMPPLTLASLLWA